MKFVLFAIGFLQLTCSCTQKRINTREIDYPGDLLVGDSVELFAPGIISLDSFEHSSPTFSPDGMTVLWSFVEMPSWKASILEMNYVNNTWSVPHRPSFSDTSASDIGPSFTADGSILYFSSSRKLPSGQFPLKGNILWAVQKNGQGWFAPTPLDSTVSSGGDYSPSVAKNGNLYFTHGPFRSPNWDIHMAEHVNGVYARPKKLPPSINTSGYEDSPFIAPDESYLIFESDKPGGVGESIDLYISFKSKTGDWSRAINMGSTINSAATERFAHVSPDGRFLFFGSNRRLVNGKPNFDIYWIRGGIINQLRVVSSQLP